MRHALLTELWYPEIGGSIQLYDAIYNRHFPAGDTVHVVAGGKPGHEELDKGYGLKVTRFDLSRYEWLKPESTLEYARMVRALRRVIRKDKIEALHCGRVIPEGLVAMAVNALTDIPYTVWVHGEDVSIYMKYPVKKRLMPEIFARARGVYANSNFTRARAALAGAPEEKLHVINPAVDSDKFVGPFDTTDLIEKYRIAGKRVLLTVGRLTRRKGHDVVLEALAKLKMENMVWVVLSDGELEQELKARCTELGLDEVVRWVGPVPLKELPRHYALADVFIMANRTLDDDDVEGFGMVFLEASASGKAVIGGNSGGVPDAVAHNKSGLLVDGASVDEVAAAIRSLMDDKALRDRLGAQGIEWARRFSWTRAAQRVRAVAAGEDPGPGP